MEENILKAVKADDLTGKWFFADDYEPNGFFCDNAYLIFNADRTSIYGNHEERANSRCVLVETPGTWSLNVNVLSIFMKEPGSDYAREQLFKIKTLDRTTLDMQTIQDREFSTRYILTKAK